MTGDGAASAAIPKLLLQKETGFRDFNFCGLLNTAFNALKDIATDPKEKDKKIAEFKRSVRENQLPFNLRELHYFFPICFLLFVYLSFFFSKDFASSVHAETEVVDDSHP